MKLLNAYQFILFTFFLSFVHSLEQPQVSTLPEFTKILDTWDEKDIKQFLLDRNIEYDIPTATEKNPSSLDQLKARASLELAKLYDASNKYENLFLDQASSLKDNLLDLKESVFSYVRPNYISEKVSRSFSYVVDQLSLDSTDSALKSKNISDWIFDTWSDTQLKAILEKNKIKFKAGAKKDDLLKLLKKNYSKISSNAKASGSYPGDWLFDAWSVENLQDWLKAHDISPSRKLQNDRGYLLKQVRTNLYPAYVALKDSKDDLFHSLNVENQEALIDHNGIKDEFINKWSESQLKEWLNYHGVLISDKLKKDKKLLVELVKENKDSLKSDLDDWISCAKEKASPILDKVPSKEDAENLVNDTFVIDVEKWPKDRLKLFLASRGISVPLFATKKDLVKLVKKHKSKRLLDFSKLKADFLFEGWSAEQIKGWLKANKVEAEGYRDDLLQKAQDLYSHLQKENFYKDHAAVLANTAKDAAVDYSNKGKNILQKVYDDYKDPVADLANTAKDTIVDASTKGKEFAQKIYDDYKDPVGDAINQAKEKVGDAAVASKNYGAELYEYLSGWTNEELANYLETFGIKNTKGWNHDKLYSQAKQQTLIYFNGDGSWFGKPEKKSFFSTGYWRDLYRSLLGY